MYIFNKIVWVIALKIMKELSDYIFEKELYIRYYKGNINIVNYKEILHFSSDKIEISYANGSIIVSGKNLVVSKLIMDEILIGGDIKSLEFMVKS